MPFQTRPRSIADEVARDMDNRRENAEVDIDAELQEAERQAFQASEFITALRVYKSHHPWKGTIEEKKLKLAALNDALCTSFDKLVGLNYELLNEEELSGNSFVDKDATPMVIHFVGRLSVLTMIHEWCHILNPDLRDKQITRMSLKYFKEVFPRNYARLIFKRFGLNDMFAITIKKKQPPPKEVKL